MRVGEGSSVYVLLLRPFFVHLYSSLLTAVWQTGELERWVRRFRRPPVAGHVPPAPPAPPQQPLPDRQQQEGPMAAMAAGLRLAEQILFVFVASLWPNALDGGEVPAMIREGGQPARNQNGDDGGEEDEF